MLKNKKIMIESILIFILAIIDLITSIYWIPITKEAVEGNVLMSYYFTLGIKAVVCAKIVLILAPLLILEYCVKHNPKFTKNAMRLCFVFYLLSIIIAISKIFVL